MLKKLEVKLRKSLYKFITTAIRKYVYIQEQK